MPTLSATAPSIDSDIEVVVFASKLPLRRRRSVPGFLLDTRRIQRQLDALLGDGGLYWYALRADLGPNEFWTVSAWRDQAALSEFVRDDPHRRVMRDRRGTLTTFATARWTATGSDLPLAHDTVVARLAEESG